MNTASPNRSILREYDYKMLQGFWHVESKQSPGQNCISYSIPITPVLQDGPMCGIVALCMAGQMLNKEVEVQEIFSVAKNNKYTSKGEMFSAKNLSKLAEMMYNCHAVVDQLRIDSFDSIIEYVLKGHPVLVPYDSDFNHAPCLRSGHSAHWTLINGFCLVFHGQVPPELIQDPNSPCLYYLNSNSSQFFRIVSDLMSRTSRRFVCGMQGKSRHFGVWSYEDLFYSNNQLSELNPKLKNHGLIIPRGGVIDGLSGNFVKLSPK